MQKAIIVIDTGFNEIIYQPVIENWNVSITRTLWRAWHIRLTELGDKSNIHSGAVRQLLPSLPQVGDDQGDTEFPTFAEGVSSDKIDVHIFKRFTCPYSITSVNKSLWRISAGAGAFQKHWWSLKLSTVNKIHIFQRMGKIFCVGFQRYPLKFHIAYTLKDTIFIQHWNFKSS